MVGSSQGDLYPGARDVGPEHAAGVDRGTARSSSDGLTVGDELRDVGFTRAAGEIIGLAGLEGSGVATLLGVLFGTRRASGRDGPLPRRRRRCPRSPTEAARRGVALVPADRRHQGLMLDRSVVRNISLVSRRGARQLAARGCGPREMMDAARRQIERLRIKVGHPDGPGGQPVGRQPAEGGHRQVAGGGAAGDAPRRPHAGRGRGRQARDLPAHPGARRRGPHRPVPVHRAAGAGRSRGPHPRALPGPAGAASSTGAATPTTRSSTPSTPASRSAAGQPSVTPGGGHAMIRRAFTMRLKPGGLGGVPHASTTRSGRSWSPRSSARASRR